MTLPFIVAVEAVEVARVSHGDPEFVSYERRGLARALLYHFLIHNKTPLAYIIIVTKGAVSINPIRTGRGEPV
jgi:hypothetical protein